MPESDPLAETSDQTVIDFSQTASFSRKKSLPFLVVIYPHEFNINYPLSEQPLTIGRSGDVALDDEVISRKHCEISFVNQKVWVKDLGSTNGTFIDGQQIQEAELRVNSRLQIGKIVMKFEYKDLSEVHYEEELYKAATIDALTQVSNRSAFVRQARNELAYAQRAGSSLGLIMCDIDYFKRVNDTYGHAAGDHVLKGVASVIQTQKRETDLLGRFGGEEFILLLRDSGQAQAQAFAERVRVQVQETRFEFEGQVIPVTLSLGLVQVDGESAPELDAMIRCADSALYRSKSEGRNKVSIGELLTENNSS